MRRLGVLLGVIGLLVVPTIARAGDFTGIRWVADHPSDEVAGGD